MSFNKHPAAIALAGLVLGSVIGSACAATTPSLAGALTPGAGESPNRASVGASEPLRTPASSHVVVGGTASEPAGAAQPAQSSTQQPMLQQQPQQPDTVTGHLSLGEIDNLARNKLASTLRGAPEASAASAAAAPKPMVPDAAPRVQAPSAPVYAPRPHVDPVAFLGAYTDGLGQHVLYQYNGSVYPALIGEKLLNGWIARRVDGQMVTVSEGRTTRHIAMSGDAPVSGVIAQSSPLAGGPSLLGDLSQPLPRGMVGAPFMQTGR